jgi:hypothetical protein
MFGYAKYGTYQATTKEKKNGRKVDRTKGAEQGVDQEHEPMAWDRTESSVSVISWNICRGLREKLDDPEFVTLVNNYDSICLYECKYSPV